MVHIQYILDIVSLLGHELMILLSYLFSLICVEALDTLVLILHSFGLGIIKLF